MQTISSTSITSAEVACFSGRPQMWRKMFSGMQPARYRQPIHSAPMHQSDIHRSLELSRLTAIAKDDSLSSSSPPSDGDSDAVVGDWVEVGIVGPSHGVRGEMKVQPLTDFPEDRLGNPGPRWLQPPPPKLGARRSPLPPDEMELEWGRPTVSKGHDVWLVKFEGIDTPEDATLLKGYRILIPSTMRSPLEDEDEFYVQELVGLKVILQETGEHLGKVVDLFDGTGAHDVLRIELVRKEGDTERKQVLIPFVKEMVPVVDIATNTMEITPPVGLLELAAPVQQAKKKVEDRGRKIRERKPRKDKTSSEGTETTSESSEDA